MKSPIQAIKGIAALVILYTLILFLVRGVSAQDSAFTFAAVYNNGIAAISSDGTASPIATPPHRAVLGMDWSPDGSLLAAIMSDENWDARLFVIGASLDAPVQLDTGPLEGGFGAAFTPDGQLLYVGQGSFADDPTAPYMAKLMQIAPAAGAQPVELGQFAHGVGCGGGSPIPADWQYWTEAGFGGTYLTLQWTPFGILHSAACSGGEAALFDPATGTSRPLGPTEAAALETGAGSLTRLVAAPNGTRALGIRSQIMNIEMVTSLAVVDLASGAVTDLPTQAQPDQVAWLDDTIALYSTRALAGDVMEPLTAEQRAVVAAALGFPDANTMGLNRYAVSLRAYNTETSEDRELYSGAAYAIGRIRAAGGGTVLFSQIANLERYVEALLAGFDPMADADGSLSRALVPISVYRLDVTSGAVALVGEGLERMTVR